MIIRRLAVAATMFLIVRTTAAALDVPCDVDSLAVPSNDIVERFGFETDL